MKAYRAPVHDGESISRKPLDPLGTQASPSLEDFRNAVKDVCCGSGENLMIVSYSRKALDQMGEGHFSPNGGYEAQTDSVLLLDVARFKYPPHWLPVRPRTCGAQCSCVKRAFVATFMLHSFVAS